jgi:integrase/recombinase XerD
MNRVRVYWEIIQKMYPQRIKQSGRKAWSSEQIQKMLEYNTNKRNKAIIHFLASTGARIGVFNYPLQMKHLRDMGDGCMGVLLYADEPEEYWSFLTPEAVNALNDYHEDRKKDNERFDSDTPVFRSKYRLGIEKPIQVRKGVAVSMMHRSINRSGVKRTRVHRNFDIQMDHGFRKRFNIILKLENSINSNIAEKIMGHSVSIPLDGTYLPSQDSRVIEKCFVEFKKAIPELTIDGTARKQAELDKAKQEKSKLEIQLATVEQLKQQIAQNKDDRLEEARQVYLEMRAEEERKVKQKKKR